MIDYEPFVTKKFTVSWQHTFEETLRSTNAKQRRGMSLLSGEHDGKALVFFVSSATRLELAAWRTYGFWTILEDSTMPDDEVRITRINKSELEAARRDPETQPVLERWERAYVIAGYPGAFQQDAMRQVYGHLHHHELTTA